MLFSLPQVSELTSQLQESQQAAQQTSAALEDTRQQLTTTAASLASSTAAASSMEQQLKQAAVQHSQLGQAHAATQQQLQAAQEQCADLQQQVVHLDQQRVASEALATGRGEALAAAQVQVAQLEAHAAELQEQLRQLDSKAKVDAEQVWCMEPYSCPMFIAVLLCMVSGCVNASRNVWGLRVHEVGQMQIESIWNLSNAQAEARAASLGKELESARAGAASLGAQLAQLVTEMQEHEQEIQVRAAYQSSYTALSHHVSTPQLARQALSVSM